MPLSLLFDPDSFYLGRAARRGGSRPDPRCPGDSIRPGGSSRADDDWFPGEPAHARNVPRRGPDWHRARRSSALHGSVSVRGLRADDVGFRGSGSGLVKDAKVLRIGSGAGFSGDRIDPAIELATQDGLDYLIFECLAERTIAIAQQAKARDARTGFDPMLAERCWPCCPRVSNTGSKYYHDMGRREPGRSRASHQRGRSRCRNSRPVDCDSNRRRRARTGQTTQLRDLRNREADCDDREQIDLGQRVHRRGAHRRSARRRGGRRDYGKGGGSVALRRAARSRVRLAAESVVRAWPRDARGTPARMRRADYRRGTFADPGYKEVGDLSRLGFPIAEVPAQGPFIITKVPGSGGCVTTATCKEQLLYEIHDPSAYLTPDTRADFSRVRITDAGPDRVAVDGAIGWPRPESLKVSVGAVSTGTLAQGSDRRCRAGAADRARLAGAIVAERLQRMGVSPDDIRTDLIGVDALHGARISGHTSPYEVRLRVAARTPTIGDARRIGSEVEALYTNGPAGGGGATSATRAVLSMCSTFLYCAELVWCAVSCESALT